MNSWNCGQCSLEGIDLFTIVTGQINHPPLEVSSGWIHGKLGKS